jgi:signal transduction histidine kinase
MISDSGYRWVVCISESELGRLLSSVVQNRKGTPDYFGLGLEIAGKRVLKFAPQVRPWHQIYYGGKGGGSKKEYLDESKVDVLVFPQPEVVGSATGDTGSRGPSPHPGDLKVMVFLTSPETLFERQTTRSFWFGCLIASASVAAAIGLAAAWRAFSRQHQLAEMKTNFVSSVSHELRAPIASIRLLAESLEKGKVQAAQKQNDYFRFIGQECRRLSSLIENVLDFSRIEQGRKEYDFEPTDVQSLVRDTVALMQTYANEKEVRIDLTIAPEMAALKDQPSLDGRAIQQALVNLIDNAVKHSPANGAVQVGVGRGAAREDARPIPKTARGDARPTTEQALVISVEDHGPGIPAAEHEKIFDRFYRTGSELRRESQGVGIGLSLVKHIVEAHGGKVRVRSVVGEGSVFTIEVPIGKPE